MFIISRLKLIVCLSVLFSCSDIYSQSKQVGSWEVVNGEYYLNRKWNLWFEAQVRSQQLADDFYYHELKGGINYKLDKNSSVFIGSGQYVTYNFEGNFESPVATHEFRLWEQFTQNAYVGRVRFEHRYRIEQRWVNHKFRNRFRYRINPIMPINKPTVEKGAVFAALHYEVFLTDKSPYFERNRFFGGLGYMISKPVTVQVGWLRQDDYSTSRGSIHKDFIQTTLFIRLRQKKANATLTPLTMPD